MAIINVRRVRDAFVRADVTDDPQALELAVSLDEELKAGVVSQTQVDLLRAEMRELFAATSAEMQRSMNRMTGIFLAALALAVGVIALLITAL